MQGKGVLECWSVIEAEIEIVLRMVGVQLDKG